MIVLFSLPTWNKMATTANPQIRPFWVHSSTSVAWVVLSPKAFLMWTICISIGYLELIVKLKLNRNQRPFAPVLYTLQIYTAGNGTHVKNVKVTSICRMFDLG